MHCFGVVAEGMRAAQRILERANWKDNPIAKHAHLEIWKVLKFVTCDQRSDAWIFWLDIVACPCFDLLLLASQAPYVCLYNLQFIK